MNNITNMQAQEETTEEQEEYEIETILEKKSLKHGKIEYLIKWKGYNDPEDRTWEPASSIPNDLVSAFESSSLNGESRESKRKQKHTEKFKSYYNSRKNEVTKNQEAMKKESNQV